MVTEEAMPDTVPATDRPGRRQRRKLLAVFVGLTLLLTLIVAVAAVWLDSRSGHEFIISQIEALEPASGLRIEVGSIEGSIYKEMVLNEVTLADPEGVFFEVRQGVIDWRPLAWIFNELNIAEAVLSGARLERLPELIDSGEDQPLLPDFDIYLGSFRADNMIVGKSIAGEEQRADLSGAIDIRSGRAMVTLDGATTRSGDRVQLTFNAEPDRNKLDLDAEIVAPADGAIARAIGASRDYQVNLAGEGDWAQWDGELRIESAGEEQAALALQASDGLFGVEGDIAANALPAGLARRLAGPRLNVNGSGRYEDSVATVDVELRSRAMLLEANGGIDLRRSALDAVRVDVAMREPSALIANMKAQDLEMRALFNGPISELRYQYLLTAPQLAFGRTLLTGVRGEGEGRRDASGWDLPIKLSFQSLIGNGGLAKRLAENFSGNAFFTVEQGLLAAGDARFTTDSLSGTADIQIPLANGNYEIDIAAQAGGFFVQGVGLADLRADVDLRPGDGRIDVEGDVTAELRRLDNGFLRGLAGGLPTLQTRLSLAPDGLLRFADLQLDAPALSFRGGGRQTAGATFNFTGTGEHDQYGAFDLELDGQLARPRIALLLASPLPAAGLDQVRLDLEPTDQGFDFTTVGGSTLGPFDGDGAILTPPGGEAQIRVDRLLVSQTVATGTIRPTAAGLAGRLQLSGGGISGAVRFSPGQAESGDGQRIRAQLEAKNARFDGEPPILIRTGSLDANILLIEGNSDITATLQAQGISRGDIVVGRVAGNARLRNGAGDATFSIAGTRGSSFNFQARAEVEPDRLRITGNGEFEGRTLGLRNRLVLRRIDGGWRAEPATIGYGSGAARFSGQLAEGSSRLDLTLSKMPLSLADIAQDDLGLGGVIDGSVNLSQRGNAMPEGRAKLKLRGLTRSGLILTSSPVDVGLNVAMSPRNAAARGIIQSEGKTIGQFQGRVTGFGTGPWQQELTRNPLFAQARFNGAAEALWRLTGVETFDLTGPVAMAADVGGTLANPEIRGQLQTSRTRLESPLTGTVISDISARGQFDGSRLVLPQLRGVTSGGGEVTGSGSFNFAVAPGEGIGIELDIDATRAQLIARDDFAATVTGPIKIRSSADGGLISGNVELNRSFFRFGRASETVALPQIKVREINRRADEAPVRVRSRPWRFALSATARNRLQVEGLGLDSEWRADLGVSGPVDNFALTGTANLIRGNYTFAGRRFSLERGRIRFVGNRPPNPLLDIEAEANLSGLNATIIVGGTGNRPEIAFSSVPALPQDELLSRLLFGASIQDLSAPEAVQLAAAVASLNSGGGLDPINQLRRAVGLDRLRILPSDINEGQGTSIAAGKYITRRAYVELITDGKGYSATRLEFQITRWLSILSTISTLGRQSVNVQVSRDY